MKLLWKMTFFTVVVASVVSSAYASSIVFEGQNPGVFSTAPSNGQAALMASVTKPNNNGVSANSTLGQLSPAYVVEQSVLGQISSKINDEIFNSGAASGSFNLGGGSLINFVRTGGNIVINITDPATGQTTITVPDL